VNASKALSFFEGLESQNQPSPATSPMISLVPSGRGRDDELFLILLFHTLSEILSSSKAKCLACSIRKNTREV